MGQGGCSRFYPKTPVFFNGLNTMQNFNLYHILKMGTPPTKYWGTYSQCTKSKEDTPPHSFIMADRGRKRFTAGEVLEAILTDQDSDNDNL